VKGEAEGRVGILTAFAAVKEMLLDVIANLEEKAAFLIADGIPIGAGNTGNEGGCEGRH
jgi:hypothetical protein